MAMSIDDNAADKKSDKSRCQLLSFHCAALHAGTQSAKIPQKILVASLNIPVILNQCGSLRSQSGQNQSSPSPELFRPDKGAVKGRNAPDQGPVPFYLKIRSHPAKLSRRLETCFKNIFLNLAFSPGHGHGREQGRLKVRRKARIRAGFHSSRRKEGLPGIEKNPSGTRVNHRPCLFYNLQDLCKRPGFRSFQEYPASGEHSSEKISPRHNPVR